MRRRGALHDRLVQKAGGSIVGISGDLAGKGPCDSAGAIGQVEDGALASSSESALARALTRLSEADRELLLSWCEHFQVCAAI